MNRFEFLGLMILSCHNSVAWFQNLVAACRAVSLRFKSVREICAAVRRFCALAVNERPYESTDLPNVMETYTASIHSLAAPYYSPEQIAAWAPVPPNAARWQERLAQLHTIVTESGGVLAGFAS